MANVPSPKSKRKSDWELTESAFQKLLEWFDGGQDSRGQRYLEMRKRIVTYFECKKCTVAEELADETLTRIARRLEEEGSITIDTPARYCYIVAHFVFLESLKKPEVYSLKDDLSIAQSTSESEEMEQRLDCLQRCMSKLEAHERMLITAYYKEELRMKIDNRKMLAESLGISLNALAIRACRIRDKLEECIQKCMSSGG
jgi:DNA-directed RNA polymerase specialized sigma24 family protein